MLHSEPVTDTLCCACDQYGRACPYPAAEDSPHWGGMVCDHHARRRPFLDPDFFLPGVNVRLCFNCPARFETGAFVRAFRAVWGRLPGDVTAALLARWEPPETYNLVALVEDTRKPVPLAYYDTGLDELGFWMPGVATMPDSCIEVLIAHTLAEVVLWFSEGREASRRAVNAKIRAWGFPPGEFYRWRREARKGDLQEQAARV